MAKVFAGKMRAKGLKFGIVISRFNEFVGKKLLDGALDALRRHDADETKIDVVWVPGGFEIAYTAQQMAKTKKYNAIICLGAIIRGDTPHFDYIATETAKGIAQAGLQSGVPTIFGVITTDNLEQAINRAGTKSGNKGAEAALSAIEMANLVKQMKK
ncbi:MAG: 6,7-dimethyl-8-ribityllumazine synthase [bacterium]